MAHAINQWRSASVFRMAAEYAPHRTFAIVGLTTFTIPDGSEALPDQLPGRLYVPLGGSRRQRAANASRSCPIGALAILLPKPRLYLFW